MTETITKDEPFIKWAEANGYSLERSAIPGRMFSSDATEHACLGWIAACVATSGPKLSAEQVSAAELRGLAEEMDDDNGSSYTSRQLHRAADLIENLQEDTARYESARVVLTQTIERLTAERDQYKRKMEEAQQLAVRTNSVLRRLKAELTRAQS